MANDYLSFEQPEDRGKYAREMRDFFDKRKINSWWVYASAKTPEICIEPKKGTYKEFLWEKNNPVNRISIEVKDNQLSFGISGYQSPKINDIKQRLEDRKYSYHDKGYTPDGKAIGRWWFTQIFNNFQDIANEFKNIESFLYTKF